jgi:tripartite-type tricarboxylate transporter receptor subunit TctC
MKLSRRNFLNMAAGATLPAAPGIARAQTFPARPIRLVSPFPAGGPADTICRILGEHMHASLGQTVLVENTAGAAGSLGVGRVARAAPDGYTLIRDLQASLRYAHRLRADRARCSPAIPG